MTGRHGLERQNEYFIPGDGISREVIQADICRYLGNDALGQKGYLIRAYRNLTSEMIADLKADSARWEAEVARRQEMGYSGARGTYDQDARRSRSPNTPPANYASSSIHEIRQQGGPSPPTYNAAPAQYMDPYGQPPYGATQNPPYPPPSFPSSQPSYGTGQNPYPPPPPQNPYSGPSQPPVSAPDVHPSSYTYTSSTVGYGYEGRNNAPRYPGPGYENDSEYSPVTSSMAYPAATTAPDPRIGMDPRYAPEPAYQDPRAQTNRPQQTRGGEAHRRTR
ncbi:Transcription factor RfeG [Rasamsonia emersonii CBS 393.64]|uniref:Transcription factor RfeG n=1 Tax=Rasamsonia emersonii (strain ATCC 16479 / CBS 393.64 / IMI 116815) TaxID=1408163 RepID=A0A0F4YK82_RASE3|nr:Transcription factor RfeG [Rasamsonia emersonii CBS 393.64]KKA18677.1 Transcription factor RfeG [Rasamsonia emersonii CBS 393.64]